MAKSWVIANSESRPGQRCPRRRRTSGRARVGAGAGLERILGDQLQLVDQQHPAGVGRRDQSTGEGEILERQVALADALQAVGRGLTLVAQPAPNWRTSIGSPPQNAMIRRGPPRHGSARTGTARPGSASRARWTAGQAQATRSWYAWLSYFRLKAISVSALPRFGTTAAWIAARYSLSGSWSGVSLLTTTLLQTKFSRSAASSASSRWDLRSRSRRRRAGRASGRPSRRRRPRAPAGRGSGLRSGAGHRRAPGRRHGWGRRRATPRWPPGLDAGDCAAVGCRRRLPDGLHRRLGASEPF